MNRTETAKVIVLKHKISKQKQKIDAHRQQQHVQLYSLGSILTRTIFEGCVIDACPISTLPSLTEPISPDDLFNEDLPT
jgi:hypothetical protein